MPVHPRPFLTQIYEEVVVRKVPAGEFRDAEHFFKAVRYVQC